MKLWKQMRGRERLILAVKVLLTVGVIYVLGYLVMMASGLFASFQKTRDTLPPIYVGNSFPDAPEPRQTRPLWPQFPRTTPPGLRSTLINGVEILSEDWESAASPNEILAYYRQQMSARGWRDVTEETHGLQPQLRDWGTGNQGLQDEHYLETYRKVMDSNLVLRRGKWSIHVITQPRKGPMRGTAVKIFGAATPSIKDFFASLNLGNSRPGSREKSNRKIESTQFSGGDRYNTTMTVQPLPPKDALQQELARLRQNGWQPFVMGPPEQNQGGYSVWLTKGRQYAAVIVNRNPDGQGSSVTLMEVTSASSRD